MGIKAWWIFNFKDRYNYIWFYNNFEDAKIRLKKEGKKLSFFNFLKYKVLSNKKMYIIKFRENSFEVQKMNIVKNESFILQIYQRFKKSRFVSKNEILVKEEMIENIFIEKNNLSFEIPLTLREKIKEIK